MWLVPCHCVSSFIILVVSELLQKIRPKRTSISVRTIVALVPRLSSYIYSLLIMRVTKRGWGCLWLEGDRLPEWLSGGIPSNNLQVRAAGTCSSPWTSCDDSCYQKLCWYPQTSQTSSSRRWYGSFYKLKCVRLASNDVKGGVLQNLCDNKKLRKLSLTSLWL